jgi:hypothetical protein
MMSIKLQQDLIFTKKLLANTVKVLANSTKGSEVERSLSAQASRLRNEIEEIQFVGELVDLVTPKIKPPKDKPPKRYFDDSYIVKRKATNKKIAKILAKRKRKK